MLPKRVKVLGQNWTIRYVKDLKDSDGQSAHGLCHQAKNIIEINLEEPEHMRSTLYHELMHAHIWRSGAAQSLSQLGLPGAMLEEQMCELAAILAIEYDF